MLDNLRIVLLIVIFSVLMNAENLGHRLGGDVYSHENTLVCYKKALKNLQYKKNFKHVEFDIRETKDNKIVVFHDRNIERIIPKNKHNIKILTKILKKKKFKKIRVKDLTLKEMTQLLIAKNVHAPTLEDVLKASIKWDLKKPIHIEVKSLHSDKARYKLIDLVNKYNKKLDISIIAFRKNFYNSFPFTPRWINIFKNNNIEAYQIDKHSFTEKSSYCSLSGSFTSLLPESTFLISKEVGRTQEFRFTLPKEIKCKDTLKIGIYGGSDDSGYEGVSFQISNKNGKNMLTGFSNTKGWEWFSLEPKDVREFILTIEDSDTRFTGKYPGNGGLVKVLYLMPQD
jgi:hypothetical protein